MANLLARRVGDGGDESSRGDDLPGRAEAALEGVGADECVDERVVAEPSIVVTSWPPTVWTSVMHESTGTPSS